MPSLSIRLYGCFNSPRNWHVGSAVEGLPPRRAKGCLRVSIVAQGPSVVVLSWT
jgi:hypothetical protein